jgi:hypothetical protein
MSMRTVRTCDVLIDKTTGERCGAVALAILHKGSEFGITIMIGKDAYDVCPEHAKQPLPAILESLVPWID